MVNIGNAPNNIDNIDDLWYALQQGGLLSDTIEDSIDDAIKTRNYGIQPDGDLVGNMADGTAFQNSAQLTAGESFTSEWFDTDGWETIEVVVEADVPSAYEGVEVQFSDDIQATTPEVDATVSESFSEESALRGYEIYDFSTALDGFRLVYTNGDTGTTNLTITATLRTRVTNDSARYVRKNSQGEDFVQVGTDSNNPGIEINRPTSLFGDLVSVQRTTLIDMASSFGTSTLRDEVYTIGSGSITQNPDPTTGEIVLNTGSTADSQIDLQTAEYGRYVPGYSAQQGIGIRIPNPPTDSGSEARWGYFDGDNGFYWGYDGGRQEMFVARKSNGTETQRIYRSNWNRNDIDDYVNRPWTVSEGSIFHIDFSWYGYGIIVFTIVTQTANDSLPSSPQQRSIPVHAIAVENTTSTSDPNNPIRVEAQNGTNAENYDVRVGGRQFSVFGKEPTENRTTANTRTGQSIGTAWTHIMTWRRKTPVQANARLALKSFDTIQDANMRYAIVVDADVTGLSFQTPNLTDPGETLVEVSPVGTFNGLGTGTKEWESLATGGGGSKVSSDLSESNVSFGQENYVSLIGRSLSGTATVTTTSRIREDW